MKFVHHGFGIRKSVRTELEVPVILLPVVIDYQYTGRETVVDDVVGVFKDTILILVLYKLHPRVVLRFGEEQFRRHFPVWSQMLCRGGKIGFFQGASRLDTFQFASPDSVHSDFAISDGEAERLVAPDVTSLVRDKQRGCLAIEILPLQVHIYCPERHPFAESGGPSPPFFARKDLYLPLLRKSGYGKAKCQHAED